MTLVHRLADDLRLVAELGHHELKAQRRETLLGLVWMVLWPLIQAGGFLIAFNLIRGGSIGDKLLLTYLGVLVWSMASMMLTSSMSFFAKNADMMKHLAFPFHLISVSDVSVKYLFFLGQFAIAMAFYMALTDVPQPALALFSLILFVAALYLVLVAIAWAGSVIGAIVPDLSVALPPILILLLAISPVFHPDLAAMPTEIRLLNLINPLSQLVLTLHGCIGLDGTVRPPFAFVIGSILFFILMRLAIRRLYQELAKII